MKLDVFKFGLAWAIATAVLIFALNILLYLVLLPRMGNDLEVQIAAALVGSVEGAMPLRGMLFATAIWSLVGGTFGTILAWTYNFLVDRG